MKTELLICSIHICNNKNRFVQISSLVNTCNQMFSSVDKVLEPKSNISEVIRSVIINYNENINVSSVT